MLKNSFELDDKTLHLLSTNGIGANALSLKLKNDLDYYLELWHSQGLNIVKHFSNYYFSTKFTKIEDETFCIVDIETNGSKIDKHQIIEIAALKIKNGQIIGSFDSFVKCDEINEHITQITGISIEDTKDAPPLKKVLYDFKLFLGDAVFVAHDVKFDYKFISQSLQKIGLPPLLNRSLCSISLAERTIESYRYALSYLNKLLDLHPEATHHRAMSDVMTTYELFKISLSRLSSEVKTTEELISFVKKAERLKRPKFDPFLFVEEEKAQE